MPFIGIFAKENDNNFIKNEINKNSEINKFEVININTKSLENLKNIKFDVLVIKESISDLINKSNYIMNIIEINLTFHTCRILYYKHRHI